MPKDQRLSLGARGEDSEDLVRTALPALPAPARAVEHTFAGPRALHGRSREHEPKRDPNSRRTLAANRAGSVAAERPPSCRFQERRPHAAQRHRRPAGELRRRGRLLLDDWQGLSAGPGWNPLCLFFISHMTLHVHMENYVEKLWRNERSPFFASRPPPLLQRVGMF